MGGANAVAVRAVTDVLETDEAKSLIASAQEAGSVRAEDVVLALGELELDTAQLDEIFGALEELNVEVVSGEVEDDETEVATQREVSTDALQLFLKDIGRVELLTAPQEIELAKRIERGDENAKRQMVEANLRLVVSIAKRYRNQGLPFLDLIQEGPSGLVRAAVKFDHFLTDETAPLPEEAAEDVLRKDALRRILRTLSARERRVLELRYGLNGEQPRTLDEVGRAFNVTRERIRQIENQCLKKLRAVAEANALREVA